MRDDHFLEDVSVGGTIGLLGPRWFHADDLAEIDDEHLRIGPLSRATKLPFGDEGLDGGGGGDGGRHWSAESRKRSAK
ncbi:MAG: hypothetical protein M3R08_10345 [Bacteroidota bacterium]|nr:hypothetical protein [Bacteroidota bacterium]